MSYTGGLLHRPLCPQGRYVPDVEGAAPCAERARPFVLAATILASAMAFIDGSVVTIALPAIQNDFGASFSALQWVANAYALLLGGLILIGGAAGDRVGRKRVFLFGIAIFALASLACALAPTIGILILARAAQGIGAALLVPQSLAIISASFPKDVRGRAIGLWAGASAMTTAMGPPLGGFLIDALDWRAVFWINLPLSVAAIWLTARFVPESRNERVSGPLDWSGGLFAIVGFGAMTIALTLITESQIGPASVAVLLCLGATGLILFLRTESRTQNPLMPLTLFRDRAFSAANVMTVFLYGALTGILFLLPFDLIERRGLSATEVGLTLLPIGVIIGILSRISGTIADRHGTRLLMVVGSLLVAASAAGLALGLDNYWLGVMTPIIAVSAGMALVVAPLTTTVMNSAPEQQSGAASGVNNAASRLAALFAVAAFGAIATLVFLGNADATGLASTELRFGAFPPAGDPSRALVEAAFAAAYSTALWATALCGALAAVIAFYVLGAPRDHGG